MTSRSYEALPAKAPKGGALFRVHEKYCLNRGIYDADVGVCNIETRLHSRITT